MTRPSRLDQRTPPAGGEGQALRCPRDDGQALEDGHRRTAHSAGTQQPAGEITRPQPCTGGAQGQPASKASHKNTATPQPPPTSPQHHKTNTRRAADSAYPLLTSVSRMLATVSTLIGHHVHTYSNSMTMNHPDRQPSQPQHHNQTTKLRQTTPTPPHNPGYPHYTHPLTRPCAGPPQPLHVLICTVCSLRLVSRGLLGCL